MSASASNVCSIFNIPDETLMKIILYLNPRNRFALADSCMRFKSLIFGSNDLTRDLDFSKNGRLTTLTDIQKYFGDETLRDVIRSVNIENVRCMTPGKILNDSIGRAVNLVDINIHGIKFMDIWQLGSFLEPLVHVKRLSVDWPVVVKRDSVIQKVLKKPLGRLTYLSVELRDSSDNFIFALTLCKKLEELRLVITSAVQYVSREKHSQVLRNLRIMQIRCPDVSASLQHEFMDLLPDPHEWTEFWMLDQNCGMSHYLEKNVQICKELSKTNLIYKIIFELPFSGVKFLGSILTSESLLKQVISITHKDVPEELCCLTRTRLNGDAYKDQNRVQCLLKIDEAKRLLKDPGYQISFLYFNHKIEPDCDAHLVVSAFPYLTELVLSDILRGEGEVLFPREKKFQRRLSRKDDTAQKEEDDPTNKDSSFKMLIENTPHVRDLTIWGSDSSWYGAERWDLEALYLIPLWKNLVTLRLAYVPVKDEKFFIHIGKECPQLQKIAFLGLDGGDHCRYASNLVGMLNHCQNLTEFSANRLHLTKLPELFTLLSNNLNLRSVRVTAAITCYEPNDFANVISPVERLLHRCLKLTTFKCITFEVPSGHYIDHLTPALERIKGQLNRPHFQCQTVQPDSDFYSRKLLRSPAVYDDAPTSFFDWKMNLIDF